MNLGITIDSGTIKTKVFLEYFLSIQEKRKSNKDKKKSNKISTKKYPLNLLAKKCVYEVLKDKNPN